VKKVHAECETLPCGVNIHKREDDKPKMNICGHGGGIKYYKIVDVFCGRHLMRCNRISTNVHFNSRCNRSNC